MSRRHHVEKAVATSNRSSKKLMSKLLKYHVIGSTIDASQTIAAAPSEGSVPVPAPQPKPTRPEPDIFQLPPLPAAGQSTETPTSR